MTGWLPHWEWLPRAPESFSRWAIWAALIGIVALLSLLLQRFARMDLLARHRDLSSLQALDWAAFERLVGEAYRKQGWRVTETGQGGADGGVDLLLRRPGKTAIVQVKHWKAKVGAPIVREMFGLMVHHKASEVSIVALGGFTPQATEFAQGKPVRLVDGLGLLAMMGGKLPDPTDIRDLPEVRPSLPRSPRPPRSSPVPLCPACSARMIRRVRARDGSVFWGCPGFPGCSGTRQVTSR